MNIHEQNGVVILELKGNLFGGALLGTMERTLQNLKEQGKTNIVIDLVNVRSFNSSGIGILISSFTTVKKNNGLLKLANLSEKLSAQFESTKLNQVFESFSSVDKAVNSFKEK
jgi:anti-sigma B factor antagonist